MKFHVINNSHIDIKASGLVLSAEWVHPYTSTVALHASNINCRWFAQNKDLTRLIATILDEDQNISQADFIVFLRELGFEMSEIPLMPDESNYTQLSPTVHKSPFHNDNAAFGFRMSMLKQADGSEQIHIGVHILNLFSTSSHEPGLFRVSFRRSEVRCEIFADSMHLFINENSEKTFACLDSLPCNDLESFQNHLKECEVYDLSQDMDLQTADFCRSSLDLEINRDLSSRIKNKL